MIVDQCANNFGAGYPATNSDPGCQWVKGNLNEGNANNPNATYNEGDSTIQRIALDGLVSGQTYTLIFTYDTTKSSKHAYDYLTYAHLQLGQDRAAQAVRDSAFAISKRPDNFAAAYAYAAIPARLALERGDDRLRSHVGVPVHVAADPGAESHQRAGQRLAGSRAVGTLERLLERLVEPRQDAVDHLDDCLLYTSPSPRD